MPWSIVSKSSPWRAARMSALSIGVFSLLNCWGLRRGVRGCCVHCLFHLFDCGLDSFLGFIYGFYLVEEGFFDDLLHFLDGLAY